MAAVTIATGFDGAGTRQAARRTIAAIAGAAALLASAGFVEAQNIGGVYSVRGTNFDGSAYAGTAEITLSSSTTCRIVWRTGGSVSTGICMRNHEAFTAAYQLGNKVGLVIYSIRPDGSMEGVWTIADQSGAGTETLTPR